MEDLKKVNLNELDELEEMVCLGSGGTVNCCNGRDGGSVSV